MPLTHPKGPPPRSRDLSPAPLFTLEDDNIPRHTLPAGQLSPDVAHQLISDELRPALPSSIASEQAFHH